MLNGIEAKGAAIAAAAQARTIAQLAERARAALPGVSVAVVAGGLVLAARGLSRRLASDAQLRWIGSLWR